MHSPALTPTTVKAGLFFYNKEWYQKRPPPKER